MKKLKILIVEGDENVCLNFREELEKYNLIPKIANNGVEAYKILYKTKVQFDYVIIDIRFPDENGVEIIKWIKTKFTSKIIIYTDRSFKDYKDICEYDYFCEKDECTPKDIVNIILTNF
jgi:DNA-binding response OmpR family regulator